MAKYTETFYDYVKNGGKLPDEFGLIEGFDKLFLQRYAGREIGFETEALFYNAMACKATIVMPVYSAKFKTAERALKALEEPSKTRTEKRDYGAVEQSTSTNGTATELPYDSATALPSGTSEGTGESLTKARTDTAEYSDYVTIDENLRLLDEMTRRQTAVLQACLDEFENCFMGVF